ncbi:FtsX-like permease family protein [Paenibacillus sp. strain BS8-2]
MRQIVKEIWISRNIFAMLFLGFLLTIIPLLIALSTYQYYNDHFYHQKNGVFKYNYALDLKDIQKLEFNVLHDMANAGFQDASVITSGVTASHPKRVSDIEVVGMLTDKLWTPSLIEGKGIESVEEKEIVAGRLITSQLGTFEWGGETYQVKGIAGKDAGRDLINVYGNKLFVGLHEMPQSLISELGRRNELRIMVRSEKNPTSDIERFITAVKRQFKEVEITITNVNPQFKEEKKSRQGVNEVLGFPYQLALIAMINGINVSYLWMYLKRKEIALRKALGASTISLIGHIWGQLFACAFLAALGSSALQWFLSRTGVSVVESTSYFISYHPSHLAAALLITLAIACLTSALPLIQIIRIEPAKALKE